MACSFVLNYGLIVANLLRRLVRDKKIIKLLILFIFFKANHSSCRRSSAGWNPGCSMMRSI
jgi:hypothetical protein